MTQPKAKINKKTLVVRLAAAAFVVASVATIANWARPKSKAADTPVAEAEKPAIEAKDTSEAAKSKEEKPTVVEPAADDKPESKPVNPFDTSAVANAFFEQVRQLHAAQAFQAGRRCETGSARRTRRQHAAGERVGARRRVAYAQEPLRRRRKQSGRGRCGQGRRNSPWGVQ